MNAINDITLFTTYREAVAQGYNSKAAKALPEEYSNVLNYGLPPEMVEPRVVKEVFLKMLHEVTPGFVEDEINSEVINTIIKYTYSKPTKGLLLMGGTGCGKSTLMKGYVKLMDVFSAPQRIFGLDLLPTYQITSMYNQKGDDIFGCECNNGQSNKYQISSLIQYQKIFDDLGSESIGHHFGRPCNVMEEVLLRRYDSKAITHATTNLNAPALRKLYGPRVGSRMKEMFINIHLKGDDRRK